MPITVAPLDVELTVVRILTDEKTKKHLESLGVFPNSKLTIVSVHSGNVICIVKGVRLGLNNDVSKKIFVA